MSNKNLTDHIADYRRAHERLKAAEDANGAAKAAAENAWKAYRDAEREYAAARDALLDRLATQ